MIISLFINEEKKQSFSVASDIIRFFQSHKLEIVAEDRCASRLEISPLSSVKNLDKIALQIAIGGDGTILRVFHDYHEKIHAPILGINLGSLGFLADVASQELEQCLKDFLNKKSFVEERLLLQGRVENETPHLALNDLVLHRGKYPSLIEFSLYVNGNFFNTFRADGIILATPTGSTAYSLAAGGPIVYPLLDAYVLTPISPHTLSQRPIVLSSDHEIEIRLATGKNVAAEILSDGRSVSVLNNEGIWRINKSKEVFKLLKFPRFDYFSILRSKLWSKT